MAMFKAMSKKDFVAIARAVKDARDAITADAGEQATAPQRIIDSMARDLASVCAAQNPRFDRSRFLTACGVK